MNKRVRRNNITSKIKSIDDVIPRLNASKQKIEESIKKREIVLANCESKIQSKKVTRDTLEKELHIIEKNMKSKSGDVI
jgi:predicted DNA-binding protein YlxM (UPF0122 family)